MMTISEFKEVFDPLFQAEFLARIDRALEVYRGKQVELPLRHLLSIARDGKRLRPYLVYLGYGDGESGLGETLLDTCIGIELFHTFALIHDDISDQDPMRRGVPTVHEFARLLSGGNARVGDSLGMLVGDLVFSWAQERLLQSDIRGYVERMIDEVTIGQIIDVGLVAMESVSEEDLDAMIELKSARYSFVRPLQIGAALRGISPLEEQFFLRFGSALGTAFQLQDDYFDREQDRDQNRPTYYARGYEASALKKMEALFREAHELLDGAPLPSETTVALRAFVRVIESRDK